MTRRAAASFSLAALLTFPGNIDTSQSARPRTQAPPPSGQRIQAQDGDVILVDDEARVKIVRRREANVRAIFNAADRWLVLLADYTRPDGADGRVDATYTFSDITGAWPLEQRWEGIAGVEDYSIAGFGGSSGFGIVLPRGLVQLLGHLNSALFQDPGAAVVLAYRGAGRSGGGTSFDETERRQVEIAIRNAERPTQMPRNAASSMEFTGGIVGGVSGGIALSAPGEQAPVRVGGTIRSPIRIVDVKPVMPETAQKAGVRGVVILELTIDVDGSVRDVRVLRSIPLLDEAAVAAARQWRYEPTALSGKPVPVIITATVAF